MWPNRTLAYLLGTVLALLVLSSPAAAAPPLVGQWHFDDTYSTPAEGPSGTPDSSGVGPDLFACNGCITLDDSGRFDNHLGGITPDCSEPPCFGTQNRSTLRAEDESGNLDGIRPARVTLLAWIRSLGTPANDQVIAAQAYDATTCDKSSYRLRHDDGDSFSGLEFSVHVGGQVVASPPVGPANTPWDGSWHLVAGTYDGAHVRLYVDGVQLGSGTPASGNIQYGSQTGIFGADGFTGNSGWCTQRDFEGGIDEMQVYSRALSTSEIASLAAAPGPTPPQITDPPPPPPDRDGDGRPDASDNCPDHHNADQRDRDGDGKGAACDPLHAEIIANPNPSCTGVPTLFSGRGSTSDSPIVRYKFAVIDEPTYDGTKSLFEQYGKRTYDLSDGAASVVSKTFTWNWPQRGNWFGSTDPAERTGVRVYLTITTADGQLAGDDVYLSFVQQKANQPRTGCPSGSLAVFTAPVVTSVSGLTGSSTVAVRTTCPPGVPGCVGALQVYQGTFKLKTSARKKRKKKQRFNLLAAQDYTLAAGQTKTIRAKLTKKARRLIKKKRRLPATVSLVSTTPQGKSVVRLAGR